MFLNIISCIPKSEQWFSFLILTVRGPFNRKDFKSKKYGDMGLIFEKKKKKQQQQRNFVSRT